MVKYDDFCVGCDYCIGYGCRYRKKLPVYYCDQCGSELDEIYEVNGEEICEYCLKKKFKRG